VLLSPILTKTWNITPNLRRTFTSLIDSMGWFFYRNKVAMLSSGWTVKFTCDGTTGPTGAGDTTDRWTSEAAVAIRGAAAGNPQSYAVLQNSDGVQVLFTYQGASDDIARVSISQSGAFTLATPSTNQPTASDEMVFTTGNSLVNSATSGDRVMTIWCSADSKHWSAFLCRQGAIINLIGVERVNSFCGTGVFTVPYVGYRYTHMDMANNPSATPGASPGGYININLPSAAGFQGCAARVFTAGAFRVIRCGSGVIVACSFADTFTRSMNDRFFNANAPAMQGSRYTVLEPIFWCGEKGVNTEGVLGTPIDWWVSHGSAGSFPAVGNFVPGYEVGDNVNTDPIRTNWLVSLGSECIRPWRDVAAMLLTG